MSVIVVLILISLAVALVFLASFIWAVHSGQFEDTVTPALRVLADDMAADPGHTTTRAFHPSPDFPLRGEGDPTQTNDLTRP